MSVARAIVDRPYAALKGQAAVDTLTLIDQAQRGDELALNRLLKLIEREHMPSRIRRFINRNVLVAEDEIKSEFLIGCWKAIPKAKLDVGNPLHFICWKGVLQVLYLCRKNIREGVRVNCTTCGVSNMVYRRGTGKKPKIACSKCGATDVETFMIVFDQSQTDESLIESGVPNESWDKIDPSEVKDTMDDLFSAITYEIQVDEIRSTLTGRVQQLFDKLVIEQINRDTSHNYLEEIADEWGVSTACVSVYLRKLRAKVIMHMQHAAA